MAELIDREKLVDAIYDLWTEYDRDGFEYVSRRDVLELIADADTVEVDDDPD